MPDIPASSVAAAEAAIRREFGTELDRPGMPEPDALARTALEAAAPLLAEAWGVTGRESRFDRNPEALAWARAQIQRVVDRYRGFQQQAAGRDTERFDLFRMVANAMERELIGGRGCTITPFDERRPELPDVP